jgi:Fe/S biogenesis protein NfuA
MTLDERIISISEAALHRILDVRAKEPDAANLALCLEVAGRRGPGFGYELAFVPVAEAGAGDVVDRYGDLPVVIPAASVESLRGAALHFDGHGLSIENPNRPPREPWWPGDDAPLGERVAAVLEHEINPAIAGHGGWAQLVEVEGDTVYLSLGGGCQGCGMAQVTLRQGIEVGLRNWVPEIGSVVDVTDHASGDHPYY